LKKRQTGRVGAVEAEFFNGLLAVLEQNPDADWRTLLGAVEIAPDRGGEADIQVDADDELATFQL